MTLTLAERLDAAADVIEQRGHCHGELEDSKGRVCVIGALNTVDFGVPRPYVANYPLGYQTVAGMVRGSVSAWNDELSGGKFKHNKRDAVRLLRKAAKAARKSVSV